MIVTGPGPFWLILMFAVNALPGHTRAQPKTFSDPSKSKLSVPILNRIRKRSSITTLGKAFYALGDQLVKVGKLFYGARFIRRQNGVSFFDKPGGTKQAMRDFERVNPSSLMEDKSTMASTSADFCVLFMLMLIHAPVQTTMVINFAEKLTENQDDISKASELNEDVSAVDQNIREEALDTIVTDIREIDKPHQGYSIKRRKRSGRFIALSFIKGLAATKSLLFGSTPARSSNLYYNEFYKRGNFATAMRDFESVNPTHVLQSKDPSGMTIKRGMVGDRMIVIESSGEIGRPTIEIVQGTGSTKPFIDKITYVD